MSLQHFDLGGLTAFRAVAELGSFRRAAETLHLSQPAFSRRIEKLEQALGVRLLERTTRRVGLTAVGRDFARKVQIWLDDLDATLLQMRGMAATRLAEVTVACIPSSVPYYLSRSLLRYRAANAKVRVKVLDFGANEVLAIVARGEADFGLNFLGAEEPDIDFQPLVEDRFVLACRRDHPLAGRRRVAWAELAGHERIALVRNAGNRLLMDQAVSGLPPARCETERLTAQLGLVEAGLGVAAVPAMPGPDHPLLVSVPLDQPVVTREVGLIRRSGRTLSPSAQQLYDMLIEDTPRPGRRRSNRA